MQKVKVVQIGTKSFTLKELPVRTVWDLMGDDGADKKPMIVRFRELLTMACPELTGEVLLDMYPSEIEELWEKFEEVNSAFLGLVRRIGLIDILIDGVKPILAMELRKSMATIGSSSTGRSASLSPPDMVPGCGTTDMVSL